jgi:hypothetical protein
MTGQSHGRHVTTGHRGPRQEPKAGVTVAIVDGHSTGRTLAHLLRRRGVACVHVHSRAVNSVAPGDRISRTVDLFTSPGYVYLASPAHNDVLADYQRLRAMEASGLYTT